MKKKGISGKQEAVLDYIRHFSQEHGYPPAVREICQGVGVSSPATVKFHLDKLMEEGYINVTAGKTRAITLLKEKNRYNQVPLLAQIPSGDFNGEFDLAKDIIQDYIPFPTQGFDLLFAFSAQLFYQNLEAVLPDDLLIFHRKEAWQEKEEVWGIWEGKSIKLRLQRKQWHGVGENLPVFPLKKNQLQIFGIIEGVLRQYESNNLTPRGNAL